MQQNEKIISFMDDVRTKQMKNFLEKRLECNMDDVPFDTYKQQCDCLIHILKNNLRVRTDIELINKIVQTPFNIGYEDSIYIGLVRSFLFIKGYPIGLHFTIDKDLYRAVNDFKYKYGIKTPIFKNVFMSFEVLVKLIDKRYTPFDNDNIIQRR